MSKDAAAVDYMLRRISEDGRLAYLLDYTEAWSLLTEAAAERRGVPVDQFRRDHQATMRHERVTAA